MGRYGPWVKYDTEWRNMRDERERPHAAESGSSWLFRSISSWLNLSPKAQSYCDQAQSLLFTLPAELRLAIWTYVVGDRDIQIVRKMTKLGHAVLPRDEQRLLEVSMTTPDPSYWGKLPGWDKRYETREVLAEETLLPLLQTSRRVYEEALAVMYATNRFDFATVEALDRFLRRSPTTGLRCVSQLKMRWPRIYHWIWYQLWREDPPLEDTKSWTDLCNAIAGLGGLRELTIEGWYGVNRSEWSHRFSDIDDYDTVVKIVAPLRVLTNRVNVRFYVRECAAVTQHYQDRLHSEGYNNVQIVGSDANVEPGAKEDSVE